MKSKSLFVLSVALFFFLSWKFIDNAGSSSADHSNINIRMRNIGHELLLHSGDSISRILPIAHLGENKFQILFESQFTFEPDTLVNIVLNTMQNVGFESGYLVNVLECHTDQEVFGFEVFEDKDKNIIPCLGRALPKQCYKISISIDANLIKQADYAYPIVSLIFCLFLTFLVFGKNNKSNQLTKNQKISSEFISLGKIQFSYKNQLLYLNKKSIELTVKETQVLKILATNPNQTLSRERLQKEVWEDEGVFVGRSLDVFVSKLRKKLSIDPSIRIVNVHGKGYKLELD